MCCLFGLLDYSHSLTSRQKSRMLSALAAASEARGTDATGIAFNSNGRLRVYKRPVAGHRMKFRVPEDADFIIGHTRMKTQGDAKINYNNHPFTGAAAQGPFALAHNGVIYNDKTLRKSLRLPDTKIETDSFVAVQLLEQKKSLNADSLKYMAEQLEGSFTFTVLDGRDSFYLVKGDSPMCIYQFPGMGLYLYASTEEILQNAMKRMPQLFGPFYRLPLDCGEILQIDRQGCRSLSKFDDSNLYLSCYHPLWYPCGHSVRHRKSEEDHSYLEELKSVAGAFGYDPDTLDEMYDVGFTPEELEEYLYSGEL